MECIYDIKSFAWNAKTRTFSQDAWNLELIDANDENWGIVVFPGGKEPFYIKNYKTGEQRLFTFSNEVSGGWVFENTEDNLTCIVWVDPF